MFAIVGGPTAQLAEPQWIGAAQAMISSMPCDMARSAADSELHGNIAPCSDTMHNCKQLDCVANAGLPSRSAGIVSSVRFSPVGYWSAWPKMAGMNCAPEPLPPRSA